MYLHSLSQSLTRLKDTQFLDWTHVAVPLIDGSQACIQYRGGVDAKFVLLLIPSITGTAEQFWRFAQVIESVYEKSQAKESRSSKDASTDSSCDSRTPSILEIFPVQYLRDTMASKVWSLFERETPSTEGNLDKLEAESPTGDDKAQHFTRANTALVVLNKRGHHCRLKTPRWDPFGDVDETAALIEVAKTLFPECKQAFAVGFSGGGLALARYLEAYASSTPTIVEDVKAKDEGWLSSVWTYFQEKTSRDYNTFSDPAEPAAYRLASPQEVSKRSTARWIKAAAIACSPLHSGMMEVVPSWLYWHLRTKIVQKYFLPNLEVWKIPGECVLGKLATRGVDELARWASPDGRNWNRGVSLSNINTPLLVVQAKDDIFWGWNEDWRTACTPKYGQLDLYETGGHLGFYDASGASQLENIILNWFSQEAR